MTIELHYGDMKIVAIQVWVCAVPEIGTLILGETPEEAQASLDRIKARETNS